MLRRIRTILKRLLFVVVVLAVIFGTMVAYLAVTSPEPRASTVWERLPDLPHPRGESTAAIGARVTDDCPPGEACPTSEAQFFVIGGMQGLGTAVPTVDVFDPGTGTWIDAPPLPGARHHPAAVGLGGTVYVTGGSISATDWTPYDNAWRLLPIRDQWDELAPMPEPRMGHQMAAVQQKLYVIGGRGPTSRVLIYDTTTDTWTEGAPMPQPRDHLAVAVSGLRIYAIGGRDTALTDRVDIYDTLNDRWLPGPALPEPMSAMAAGSLSDGIHVVGGEDSATVGGGVIDRHYVLKPGGEVWEEAPLPILATHGSASAVLRDSLVIAGGARRQGALSPLGWTGLTEVYDPRAAARATTSPQPLPS